MSAVNCTHTLGDNIIDRHLSTFTSKVDLEVRCRLIELEKAWHCLQIDEELTLSDPTFLSLSPHVPSLRVCITRMYAQLAQKCHFPSSNHNQCLI